MTTQNEGKFVAGPRVGGLHAIYDALAWHELDALMDVLLAYDGVIQIAEQLNNKRLHAAINDLNLVLKGITVTFEKKEGGNDDVNSSTNQEAKN